MALTLILTAVSCCAGAALYGFSVLSGRVKPPARRIAKAIPGAVCAAASLSAALRGEAPFGGILAAALLLCAAADYVLEIAFLPGMAVFAAAHVTLIVYMALRGLYLPACACAAALLFTALVWALTKGPLRPRPPVTHIAYAALLCLMVSCAAGRDVMSLLGAVCFLISDSLLAVRILTGKCRGWKWGAAIMGTYYGALYLLCAAGCLMR